MAQADPWAKLRDFTRARIALGHAGGSLPTKEVLSFAAAHAAARDAIHESLDWDKIRAEIAKVVGDCVLLRSAAKDRTTYLQRPDLGRLLDEESIAKLSKSSPDIAVIVSDGLSAPAAARQAVPLLAELLPRLKSSGMTCSPVYFVRHARVAIEDEIGEAIGAKAALILLGERPGLGSPDSLGAYLVFNPRRGKTDAERNCVSNIRPEGQKLISAAETLCYLITQSLRLRFSGVALKDDRPKRRLS